MQPSSNNYSVGKLDYLNPFSSYKLSYSEYNMNIVF